MKVLVYPHPDLRKKAQAAPDLDFWPMLEALAEKMKALGGVGLASTQVGLVGRWFVWQTPDMAAPELVLDPQWEPVHPEGSKNVLPKVEVMEGCLSVPGFSQPVRRFGAIEAQWKTPEGEEVKRASLTSRLRCSSTSASTWRAASSWTS